MNILIISQDLSHVKLLCRQINRNIKRDHEEINTTVLSAPSDFDANYDKSEIDLIITDIVMSGKNGLEVITESKASHPNITILAISETFGIPGKSHYMPIATMLGADVVIGKPFNTTHFADILSKMIELKLSQLAA